MMTTKHTKAPWRVVKGEGEFRDEYFREIYIEGTAGGEYIAEVWREGEEREANAALIASAPELLAMLRECLPLIQGRADELKAAGAPIQANLFATQAVQARRLLARATGIVEADQA